jgi:hypothetical protein
VAIDSYSWELTTCKNKFNGYKIIFNAHFIPPTSLLELSFPPLKSDGSSFSVIVPNGPTPSVFPFSSSSSQVSSFGVRIKGLY